MLTAVDVCEHFVGSLNTKGINSVACSYSNTYKNKYYDTFESSRSGWGSVVRNLSIRTKQKAALCAAIWSHGGNRHYLAYLQTLPGFDPDAADRRSRQFRDGVAQFFKGKKQYSTSGGIFWPVLLEERDYTTFLTIGVGCCDRSWLSDAVNKEGGKIPLEPIKCWKHV